MVKEWFREQDTSFSHVDWPPELSPIENVPLDTQPVDSASVSDPALHVHGLDCEAQPGQCGHDVRHAGQRTVCGDSGPGLGHCTEGSPVVR